MAERLLSVKVRADVADFLRGAGLVEDATRKMGDSAKRAGDESKKGLGGVAQSMRDNQAAWTQVGGALTTYGAAVTGVATAVAATGISYNQLRQTSVAALTTMTGSAEAANRQMDRLDDFASNSPFARDVFIRAQQQLIGFGFEAERVVPILDAIQNAVAATGGSNQDIAELTRIIAQVGAAGKITAQDLNQFGQRGVDAATLIGEQMGYTGQEIREQITRGTLDAGAALDALVIGMQESYGGAADNVKNTFAGAVDRVKAAFRDLSSLLMEPLVSRDGGGFLQDAVNGLADFLRMIERVPTPILLAAGGLTAFSGAASLAAGGFMLLGPQIVSIRDSAKTLAVQMPRTATAMGRLGRAAGIAAGVAAIGGLVVMLSQLGQENLKTSESAEVLENRLRELATGGGDLSGLLQGTEGVADFNAELERLAEPSKWQKIGRGTDDFLAGILGLGGVLVDHRSDQQKYRHSLEEIDSVLAQVAATSREDGVAAFQALAEAMDLNERGMSDMIDLLPGFRDYLVSVATEMGIAADDATLLGIATGQIAPPPPEAADGMSELGDEVKSAAEEAEEAQKAFDRLKDSISSLGDALLGVRGSARDYEAQLDRIKEAMKDDEWKRTLDITTEAGRENQAMLDGLASSTVGYASAALEAGAGMGQVSLIMQRGREDFIATAEAMGMTAEDAATLADNLGLIPDDVEMMFRAAGLDELIVEANGVVDFASSLEALINLGIEPIAAETMLTDFLRVADSSTATVTLDAEETLAEGVRLGFLKDVNESVGTVGVWADDTEAQATRRGTIIDINDSDGTVTIYGNGGEALRTADNTVWSINQKSATISVYAQVRTTAAQVASQARRLIGGIGLPGFESGGYSGDGDPKQIAGLVHGREFVSDAETTADPHNRAALEYMHAGGSMRTLVEQSAASYSPQWASQVAASYAAAPVMQPAAPAVHVQPIDYARLAAAVSQIQVRPQIGDDEVHRGARRGAALYGDRATWGTGPQPGRRS